MSVCPPRTRNCWPVFASHSQVVDASLPVANTALSRDHATDVVAGDAAPLRRKTLLTLGRLACPETAFLPVEIVIIWVPVAGSQSRAAITDPSRKPAWSPRSPTLA